MSAKAVFSREDVNLDTFLHFLLPSARSRHLCPCVPPDSRGIEHVSFRRASHFSSENRKNVADKETRDCLGRLELVKIRKSRDHSITQTHQLQEEERVSDQTGQKLKVHPAVLIFSRRIFGRPAASASDAARFRESDVRSRVLNARYLAQRSHMRLRCRRTTDPTASSPADKAAARSRGLLTGDNARPGSGRKVNDYAVRRITLRFNTGEGGEAERETHGEKGAG